MESVKEFSVLLARAKAGDKDAYAELYKSHVTALYRYVYMRVKNKAEAEDIVQDTFMKTYIALPRFETEGTNLYPYLYTVARNLIINAGKKKRAETMEQADLDHHSSGDETSKQAEDAELSVMLRSAMGSLSPTEREIIELRYFGERSYREIAEIVKKREDAVRQHVVRAMRKMRAVVGEKLSVRPSEKFS